MSLRLQYALCSCRMSPDDCFDLSEGPFKDIEVPDGRDFSTVAALLRALTQRCGIRPEAVDGYKYMVVARAVHSVMRILGKEDQVRNRLSKVPVKSSTL